MSFKITDKCIGCQICTKNCPVEAITGTLKEIHTINEKRCVDCGACGRVCPKEAIVDSKGVIQEKIDKTKWKKPVVNKEKCSACSMCVNECGFNCLSISNPKFHGDFKVFAELTKGDQCVSCEMCAKICPLKAITMGV